MKAVTAQIYVGGKLVLHATNVSYQEKSMTLKGMKFTGTVEKVHQPTHDQAVAAFLQGEAVKGLEIRLNLF